MCQVLLKAIIEMILSDKNEYNYEVYSFKFHWYSCFGRREGEISRDYRNILWPRKISYSVKPVSFRNVWYIYWHVNTLGSSFLTSCIILPPSHDLHNTRLAKKIIKEWDGKEPNTQKNQSSLLVNLYWVLRQALTCLTEGLGLDRNSL